MSMIGEDPKHEQTPASSHRQHSTPNDLIDRQDAQSQESNCKEIITSSSLRDTFRDWRFNSAIHLGLGDVRLSLGAQNDVCDALERLERENAALREQLALAEAERDLRPEVHEHTDALFALRQQLAEARRKALERAAQTCDDHARSYGAINPDRTEEQRRFDYRCEYALKNAAQAIRALIDQPAQGKEDK